MAYEKYKTVRTPNEFWEGWNKEELANLNPQLMEQIYNRYLLKCIVFQRDNFECQNEQCQSTISKITLHHIKFQKNKGVDKPKNCVTICDTCHKAFHKGKTSLTFWGMTYQIHKSPTKFNWKQNKSKVKQIRKDNKEVHGVMISLKLLKILIKFLEKDYSEMCLDD